MSGDAPRPGSLRGFLPNRRDLTALIDLAVPVAVVQVGLLLMGAVDTIMVGRVSPADLAAVALGNLYFFGVAGFGMGVLFALDPIISQAVGAGDSLGVARGLQRGFVLAAVMTVVAAVLLLPAEPIMTWLRQPDEVIPVASGYTLASIPGVFPFYAFVVLRQSLQAMGRVRPIVITVVAANALNVVLNWVLVFGKAGVPPMGAVGSSVGTSLSRWFMTLGLLALGWPLLRSAVVPLRREAVALEPLRRILRVGAPIGGQQVLEFGVFGAAGLLMGLIGTVAMASHQVALNLAALVFMVPVGVAQAASVLVGRAVGAGDPHGARRAAGAGLLVGAGFMTCSAILFLSIPGALARLFSTDRPVVVAAALLIPVAGIFQLFDGLQVVAAGVLRGVGDTRVPMLVSLIGFWLIGLPVSAVLSFPLGMGPVGIWWGLAAGLAATAVLLLFRVRARFGRDLRRLLIDEDVTA